MEGRKNVLEHDIDLYHYEYMLQGGVPLIAYGKQIKIESDFIITIDPNAPDTVFIARYYRSDRTHLVDEGLPLDEEIEAPLGASYLTLLFIRSDFEISPLSYAKDNNIQVLVKTDEPVPPEPIKEQVVYKPEFVNSQRIVDGKEYQVVHRRLDENVIRRILKRNNT